MIEDHSLFGNYQRRDLSSKLSSGAPGPVDTDIFVKNNLSSLANYASEFVFVVGDLISVYGCIGMALSEENGATGNAIPALVLGGIMMAAAVGYNLFSNQASAIKELGELELSNAENHSYNRRYNDLNSEDLESAVDYWV